MQQQPSIKSISDICSISEDANSRSLSKTCAKPREDSLQNYKFVFILGQLFHGVGAAALITLGTTFLDESVSQKMSPIFIDPCSLQALYKYENYRKSKILASVTCRARSNHKNRQK